MQIVIQDAAGQSAQDLRGRWHASLDERERRLKAKARSNYSNQGDQPHDDGAGIVRVLRTVPYQELQYQRSWRHAANSWVNRRPSTPIFWNEENDMLTLSVFLCRR